MTPVEIALWFGPAIIFGASVAGMLVVLACIAGWKWDMRQWLTLTLAVFFLTLTQTPLPDAAALDCTDGGVAPNFRPFSTWENLRDAAGRIGFDVMGWVGNQLFQALIMNFVIPALIGAALARHMGGQWAVLRAFAVGFGLSLLAETAQMTALFGLYPCPWRRTLMDDLIVNTLGCGTGFMIARWSLRRKRQLA